MLGLGLPWVNRLIRTKSWTKKKVGPDYNPRSFSSRKDNHHKMSAPCHARPLPAGRSLSCDIPRAPHRTASQNCPEHPPACTHRTSSHSPSHRTESTQTPKNPNTISQSCWGASEEPWRDRIRLGGRDNRGVDFSCIFGRAIHASVMHAAVCVDRQRRRYRDRACWGIRYDTHQPPMRCLRRNERGRNLRRQLAPRGYPIISSSAWRGGVGSCCRRVTCAWISPKKLEETSYRSTQAARHSILFGLTRHNEFIETWSYFYLGVSLAVVASNWASADFLWMFLLLLFWPDKVVINWWNDPCHDDVWCSASLASLTRETGPKVVRGDPARKGEAAAKGAPSPHPQPVHHHHPHVTPTIAVSDSSLKFTHVLYNLSPAGTRRDARTAGIFVQGV